jgi:acyl-CoA thioester hydrolase
MSENKSAHITEFRVRDYECDIQGIVNNANYQHYLEHARHEFLISKGVSFQELHDRGIDLVVTRVEINYKSPLRSRDSFIVKTRTERNGNVRLLFIQDIVRMPDEKTVINAIVTGVATKNGKPVSPGSLVEQLGLDQD